MTEFPLTDYGCQCQCLYKSFLRSITFDDATLEDILKELTLDNVLSEIHVDNQDSVEDSHTEQFMPVSNVVVPSRNNFYQYDDFLRYGSPVRRHLPPTATRRLREEIGNTLRSLAEFFYGVQEYRDISKLPQDIKSRKDEVNTMQLEIDRLSLSLEKLASEVKKEREEFDSDLKVLISTTLPAFDAVRNVSINVLAATIEASLQKLDVIRGRSRQAFYNHRHQVNTTDSSTVVQAIVVAYSALKKEEKDLKAESQKLDRQIQEYETLLELVDGDGGGYQQVVKDWLKTKQETDECLKDLRRLGWTGD